MKKLKVKEKDKFRIHYGYDKETNCFDLIADWPSMKNGFCDAGYLFSHVFTSEVLEELKQRGWDISTLKFSIEPKLVEPTRPERFQKLLEKYEEDIKKL